MSEITDQLLVKDGGWRRKPYLRLAPDAYVFINQRLYVVICTDCGARRDLRSDISDITVTKDISGGPGSATITLVAPRHGTINEYYFRDGRCIIPEMSEVEIYMKGRFLGADLKPRYYPVFWGVATDVTADYSDGAHMINLSCEDMLYWLGIQTTNLRPTVTDAQFLGLPEQAAGLTNRFSDMNIFDIVREMFRFSMADMLGPGNSKALNDMQGISGAHLPETSPSNLKILDYQMMNYWKARLSRLTRSLKIMGLSGQLVVSNDKYVVAHDKPLPASSLGEYSNEHMHWSEIKHLYLEDFPVLSGFFPYSQLAGVMSALEYSERISKLDMINQVKTLIGWEFYQDMNGECIFKPPFWNIDVTPNYPVSWIEDEDVRSMSLTSSAKGVQVTKLDVKGSLDVRILNTIGEVGRPHAFYIDFSLALQFGIKQQTKEANWLKRPRDLFVYAILETDRMNVGRDAGSVTICGRPELRLGYPVYIQSKDAYYYVNGITHSFSWSGKSFNTTLNLTAGRHKIRRKEIRDLPLPINVTNLDPAFNSTNPNDTDVLLNAAASYTGATGAGIHPTITPTQEDIDRWKEELNHSLHAMQLGGWAITPNTKVTHVDWDNNPSVVVPFTDEKGYRVYGGFEYGRGLLLDHRGVITKSATLTAQQLGGAVSNISGIKSTSMTLSRAVTATIAPDDKLLKFEDQLTAVSQIGGNFDDPATDINLEVSTEQSVTLSPTLSIAFCTCKLTDKGFLTVVKN